MSAPACPHCTGSHHLADQPELGPCVCCTPEAMHALETELGEVAVMEAALVESEKELRKALESLDEREVELSAAKDAIGEDERESLADAAAHLRTYLVRQGFSANPVTLADPDLWALCGLLF